MSNGKEEVNFKEKKKALTDSETLAIRDEVSKFIGKWAAVIGVSSLFAIIAAAVYIFLLLPQKAVDIAMSSITGKLGEQITDIEKQTNTAVYNLGKLDGKMEEFNKNLSKAELNLNTIANVPKEKINEIVSLLANTKNIDILIGLNKRIKKAENELPDIERNFNKIKLLKNKISGIIVETGTIQGHYSDKTWKLHLKEGDSNRKKSWPKYVEFKSTFPLGKIPELMFGITAINGVNALNAVNRISVSPNKIDHKGFNFTIYVGSDSTAHMVIVRWMAIYIPGQD